MPDEQDMPPDPFGKLSNTDEFATILHELYESSMKAGFNDEQSMAIVLNAQTTMMNMNVELEEDGD